MADIKVTAHVENHFPELAAKFEEIKIEAAEWGADRLAWWMRLLCPVSHQHPHKPHHGYGHRDHVHMYETIFPHRKGPSWYEVTIGADYGIYVVFGTRYMAGNNFPWRAVEFFEPEFQDKVQDMVDEAVAELAIH